MRSRFHFSLLFLLLLPPGLRAQEESGLDPAKKLYEQALVESERASKLERRGKREPAIDAYEWAGRLAAASITELERAGQPETERAPEIPFRCGTSYLHAGRLLTYLKREGDRKDEDLRLAVQYLEQVEAIERARAARLQVPVNPEIWRVHNAIGFAHFLRGELAQARLQYGAVLEVNPSYQPAEQAIAEINKLEQAQNELFTPQGRTLQKEKNRKLLRGLVDTLRLVRDIVTLGR